MVIMSENEIWKKLKHENCQVSKYKPKERYGESYKHLLSDT